MGRGHGEHQVCAHRDARCQLPSREVRCITSEALQYQSGCRVNRMADHRPDAGTRYSDAFNAKLLCIRDGKAFRGRRPADVSGADK